MEKRIKNKENVDENKVIKRYLKVLYKQKDGKVREYNIALLYFLTK